MTRRKGNTSQSTSSSSTTASRSGTSRTRSATTTVRETIRLPPAQVISDTPPGVLQALEALRGTQTQQVDPSTKYPVIIGSRAASEWLPSFRECSDWDVVATPQQAISMIQQQGEGEGTSGLRKIKLIKQPLLLTAIKRRAPMPVDIQERISRLPAHLYKISGETATGSRTFEIEVVDYQDQHSVHSSAVILLNLCNNAPLDEVAYLPVAFGKGQRNQAIVAPLALLEALKTSHICWSTRFEKHIIDLHTFRAFLASGFPSTAAVNLGYHADKSKSLTPPARSPQVEEFLAIRTLEMEAIRGTPGAQINSSEDDFFGHESDLLVAGHLPHQDIHTMVMYDDEPVYDSLKTDTVNLSRNLFEQAPYGIQLQCIKEETMVIALERFLVPKLTSDPASAYRSALIRICTTLTKGWFRQFAVDNFPRLTSCDKDLLPIRDSILDTHPAPQEAHSLERLKKAITNLDDLTIIQQLVPLGRSTTLEAIKPIIRRLPRIPAGTTTTQQTTAPRARGRRRRANNERHSFSETTNYWIIHSTASNRPALVISYTESHSWDADRYEEVYKDVGTLSVHPLIAGVTLSQIKKAPDTRQKAVAEVTSEFSFESWEGEDIGPICMFRARSLENEVGLLDIDGLTEDLLMAYIVDLVYPSLSYNADSCMEESVRSKKASGIIPMSPHNHLWFDLWKCHKPSN